MRLDKDTLNSIHPLAYDTVAHLHTVGGVSKQDMESWLDTMARHGLEGGVPGFVYDSDCVAFLRRTDVLEKARLVMADFADGVGEPLWRVATTTAAENRIEAKAAEADFNLQRNGARLLVWDIGMLTSRDYQWLATKLVWFAVQRVAYAFEDADGWRGEDPGDPERGSDGYGDMEGGTNE